MRDRRGEAVPEGSAPEVGRGSARATRLRVGVAVVTAVAAVIVCMLGARAVVRDPLGTSSVRAGEAVERAAVAPPTSGQVAPREEAQASAPVPRGFVSWAASARFGTTQFLLGQGDCSSAPCPVLLRSSDSGRTWVQVHAFGQADVSAAQGVAQPRVQPAGALSKLVFVSASSGYVFGSDLWVTHDGGRTFVQIRHPGNSVLDVAEHEGHVVALTTAGCIQGECSGRLEVARLTGGATPAVGAAFAGVSPASGIRDARLVVSGRALVVVSVSRVGTTESAGAWRLAGDALSPLPTAAVCNGKALDVVAAAGTRLIGLCDAVVTPATTSWSTVRSDDGGQTWELAGVGNVTLPTHGDVALAATDASHLVAATGGPREAPDGTTRSSRDTAITASADAGATWKTAEIGKGPVDGGFDSLEAAGGGVIALTRTDGALWRADRVASRWQRDAVDTR